MLTFDDRAAPTVGAPYGLGLMDYGNGYWGHAGETAGFQTIWFTNPGDKITVVGLSNSAAFSSWSFMNARNILNQGSAQPLSAVSFVPGFTLPTHWNWIQQQSPTGVSEIRPGTTLDLSRDGTAYVTSATCDIPGNTYVAGTFTVDAAQRISFKFEAPDESCKEPGDAVQLAELLTHAAAWQLKDGNLVIELAADGGTLLFEAK